MERHIVLIRHIGKYKKESTNKNYEKSEDKLKHKFEEKFGEIEFLNIVEKITQNARKVEVRDSRLVFHCSACKKTMYE